MFEVLDGVLTKYNGNEKEVIIGDEITSIGDFAFYNCLTLEKVVILDGTTSIGEFAFYGCEHLKEVIIPDSVQLIGAGAFSCCYELTEITLPKNLRTINKSLFYRCRQLKKTIIPHGVSSMDREAFGYCSSLEEIELPDGLKSIGNTAFEYCTSLTKLSLPDTVVSLGNKVFYGCENLRHLTLSKQLKEVGLAAFETHSHLSIISNDTLLLKPKMFDEHYMFDVKSKNEGNYQFENSYLPCINFNEWKSVAKVILLINFLETYHQHENKDMYINALQTMKSEVIHALVTDKRFDALNQALDEKLIVSSDMEPYFDKITDREEKAKLLEYKNKENKSNDGFLDLDNLLDDLF